MATPGGSGPIGPFPGDLPDSDDARDGYDRLRRRVLRSLPYGLYVVGSRAGDRRNAMTLNWATQLAFEPKLRGHRRRADRAHPRADRGRRRSSRSCTIAREDRAVVRKFTKPVEVDADARTLNGFAVPRRRQRRPDPRHGGRPTSTARCASRSPCGLHTLFIGEVVDAGFQHEEATELLRMEDTRMDYGG